MLHIEPIEEVITKRKLVIEIDEDEIANILTDARTFQKELRKQRAKWYGPAGWKLNGHVPARAKRVAKNAAEKKSGKVRGVKCPKCHKVFKALGRHSATCTGNKDPLASARVPSALDE
jgi:hypothetical protein